ncbi:unnamed protein product [Gadus morhua 'NCC']
MAAFVFGTLSSEPTAHSEEKEKGPSLWEDECPGILGAVAVPGHLYHNNVAIARRGQRLKPRSPPGAASPLQKRPYIKKRKRATGGPPGAERCVTNASSCPAHHPGAGAQPASGRREVERGDSLPGSSQEAQSPAAARFSSSSLLELKLSAHALPRLSFTPLIWRLDQRRKKMRKRMEPREVFQWLMVPQRTPGG